MKEQVLTFADKLIWLLTLALVSSFTILGGEMWGNLFFASLTALILIIQFLQGRGVLRFKLEAFHLYMLAFSAFCFLSSIWSLNGAASLRQGFTVFQILVCMSVLYMHYRKLDNLWPLISILKWNGFIVALYTIFFIGVDKLLYTVDSALRLESDYANVNTIGMAVAVAIIISFHEWLFIKKNYIDLLMMLPCAFVIAATASRKALIMIFLGCLMSYFFKTGTKNIFRVIGSMIVGIALLVIIYTQLSSLEFFAQISKRMDSLFAMFTGEGNVDGSAALRFQMIQIGWNYFLSSPIFGYGIGSSSEILAKEIGWRTYLHNNFVEILSAGGVLGFLTYYFGYAYCGWNFVKKFNKSYITYMCIILLLMRFFMNGAMVEYYSKETYFYFLLFFLQAKLIINHSECIKEGNKNDC